MSKTKATAPVLRLSSIDHALSHPQAIVIIETGYNKYIEETYTSL